MTNRELNRDIKRLIKLDMSNDFKLQLEFHRLYDADRSFEAMSKQSIRIMMRLNIRHRFVAFHTFGLHIDLN